MATWNVVDDLREVLAYGFMQNAFIAGTLVAIMAAVVGYFVVLRRLAFATEALSHSGFAGATGAVLVGQSIVVGLLAFSSAAGVLMGLLGDRLRGRDVAIGATLAFSLALGSLFLTVSTKLAGEAVNILFGNILAISPSDLRFVVVFAAITLCAIGAIYRPLLFASLDPEIAEARGLPVRGIDIAFMLLLGFTVATAVQVVGVLLIFALLILPAAAAQHMTARPAQAILCAVGIAVLCVWLGLVIGFCLPYPPSFFITTLAFGTYVVARSTDLTAACTGRIMRHGVGGCGIKSARPPDELRRTSTRAQSAARSAAGRTPVDAGRPRRNRQNPARGRADY